MISKDELDSLIYDGFMYIQHDNSEQWLEIHDYLVRELNVKPSMSRLVHDYTTFPYVFIRNRKIDASKEPVSHDIISYEEFKEIVLSSEEQILCASLDDIL